MKAVLLDAKWMDDVGFAAIESQVTEFDYYLETQTDERLQRCQGAEVVLVNKVVIDDALMAQLPELKLICVIATGTNNIDLAAAKARGIAVTNCAAYGVTSVAQHTLALMLALMTRLVDYNNAVKAGEWQKASTFCMLNFPIMELESKTLGIVGYGDLGQAVAKLARALGMTVKIAARPNSETIPQGRVAFDELIKEVDILSLHCPLTEQTKDLVDDAVIAQMKPGSYIVNCARGGVVNEEALAQALRSGQLAGAATDVLSQEPPTDDNPLLAADLPNLIITPHSAWGSQAARTTIVAQAAENIAAFKKGEKLRRVD